MLEIDVQKMWEAQIVTKAQARSFVAWNTFVLGDGRMWHIEDDAAEATKGSTGEPFWTADEAFLLNSRSDECFELLGGEVYDTVCSLLKVVDGLVLPHVEPDGEYQMVLVLVDGDGVELERGLVKGLVGLHVEKADGRPGIDALVLAGGSYDVDDLLARLDEAQAKG